ncbi:MAG: DeoR/GlpR transcriptional regulator [Chthoniobacterales bacterium]|nr:DeoR/GlpR transcriptional regulator [Chthoniobacterales bacterium]
MLAVERHRWLLERVNAQGSIRTSQVAQALGVTEETVRRDFEKLAAEGMLMRSHGGAVRLDANRRESPVQDRAEQNIGAKQAIAAAAMARIKVGQTVYFDASTTVLQLAFMLPEQPLTVVTNGLQIAMALAEKSDIDCVLLGGSLRASSLSTGGWASEKALDIYHLDAAFLSCRGVDPQRGMSDAGEVHARLKHAVMERSDEVILLADSSKVGLASSYFFARPGEIDLWITDRPLPPQVSEVVKAQGLRVQAANED